MRACVRACVCVCVCVCLISTIRIDETVVADDCSDVPHILCKTKAPGGCFISMDGLWDITAALGQDCSLWDRAAACGTGQRLCDRTAVCGTGLVG